MPVNNDRQISFNSQNTLMCYHYCKDPFVITSPCLHLGSFLYSDFPHRLRYQKGLISNSLNLGVRLLERGV